MRRKTIVVIPVLLLLIMGCANLRANYDKATPQERMNLWLYGMQKSLGVAVDAGAAYVKAHPEPKVINEWQTRIIPAMDSCNKILRDLIIANNSKPEGLNIPDAMNTVVVRFNEIQSMLKAWGIQFKF